MSREGNESPRRAMVLVVDDEPAVGKVLARILRDHDVTVVTNAEEALALLAAGRTFDAILSDITMPEMSGMAFYEELTRRFPVAATRLAFLSGGIFSPDVREFLDRVPSERLSKPLDVESVRSLVQRLIDQ